MSKEPEYQGHDSLRVTKDSGEQFITPLEPDEQLIHWYEVCTRWLEFKKDPLGYKLQATQKFEQLAIPPIHIPTGCLDIYKLRVQEIANEFQRQIDEENTQAQATENNGKKKKGHNPAPAAKSVSKEKLDVMVAFKMMERQKKEIPRERFPYWSKLTNLKDSNAVALSAEDCPENEMGQLITADRFKCVNNGRGVFYYSFRDIDVVYNSNGVSTPPNMLIEGTSGTRLQINRGLVTGVYQFKDPEESKTAPNPNRKPREHIPGLNALIEVTNELTKIVRDNLHYMEFFPGTTIYYRKRRILYNYRLTDTVYPELDPEERLAMELEWAIGIVAILRLILGAERSEHSDMITSQFTYSGFTPDELWPLCKPIMLEETQTPNKKEIQLKFVKDNSIITSEQYAEIKATAGEKMAGIVPYGV